MNKKIATNIITGFLGVGKTTSILQLLKQKKEKDKWAVLVNEVSNKSVYLEEYSRSMIQQEELHSQEVEKMIKSN